MSDSAFIREYRRAAAGLDWHDSAAPCAPHVQINRIAAHKGTGLVDVYDFGRVVLGRGDYCLHEAQTVASEMSLHYFGINILLAGEHRLEVVSKTQPFAIRPPVLFLRKGHFGKTAVHIPAHTRMCVISLDFAPALLDGLSAQGGRVDAFFRAPAQSHWDMIDEPAADLLQHARHILELPAGENERALMLLESAALALLATLFAPPEHAPDGCIAALRHILDTRAPERLTIRELARLCGRNECDLKRDFKAQTGSTIAAYARKQRLLHAVSLLQQGAGVQEAASASGYDNVAYFVRIFTAQFGTHPKNYAKT